MRVAFVMLALSACDGEAKSAPVPGLPAEAASPAEASFEGASSADAGAVAVRLLVGGTYHDYDTLPPVLVSRVEAKGSVEVSITRDPATLEDLDAIDVLWMHTCLDSPLPAAALGSVQAFVDRGGGLVAMHCAVASFRQTPNGQS